MSRGRYRRLLGRRPAQEVDAELRLHLDLLIEALMARGLDEDEARRAALERMGDLTGVRAGCVAIDRRLQRRETMAAIWDTLVQDVRLAARMLARQKLWTALAVLTLGIGIGANSALFSIVNAVLLRPLPFAEPDRIMSITTASGGTDTRGVEEPTYLAWKERAKSLSMMAAYRPARTIMKSGGDPEIVTGRAVTHGYFSILGARPVLGRTFTPDEDKPGGPSVVILNETLWRRLYNGDSSIVNRTILLDETPATVVGILPASVALHGPVEFWRPYRMRPPAADITFFTSVIARLAPGATIESARAELQATMPPRRGAADAPPVAPVVMTLHERRFGDTRPALLMLFAAVSVLLLIACANVANLLLARAARRQREFAVRAAIGASAWRLVRFTLCESLLLSMMGAAVGLFIATATLGTFVRLSPPSIASADGIAINGTVVLFALGLAVVTGVGFGLIPALQVGRVDLSSVLTNASARTAGGSRQSWTRRALVVAELATALVLLTGAGLLMKSFAAVTSADTGLDASRIVVTTVDLPRRYAGAKAQGFFDEFTRGVAAIEGVEAVSLTDAAPLAGVRMSRTIQLPGRKLPPIDVSAVEPQYFRVSGVRVVAGRVFDGADLSNSEGVAILNETAARVLGGGVGVVGQRLPLNGSDAAPVTVIGVVQDILQRGVEAEVLPLMYQPLPRDAVGSYMTVVARSRGNPSAVIPAIRGLVRRMDPNLPVPEVKPLAEQLATAAAPRKFNFMLVGAFAAIGALLAIVGLYGVMSYLVAERTNEIGIRVALGADSGRITRFVAGEGMAMALIGVGLGFAGSLAAVRLLRTMLFKVSIYDPAIFAGGAVLLLATAALACTGPARRAARLDPVEALRSG